MSLGRTRSVALIGVDGGLVDVEADIGLGLPNFAIGGLPDAACRQSADRIKAAAGNSGIPVPNRRITVNMSPASLPKTGSVFDLPIAVAVLAAAGAIPEGEVADVVHLGELGLDGSVRGVRGVLPSVLAAARQGVRRVVVPRANAAEAALVTDVEVLAVSSLGELIRAHRAHADGASSSADTVDELDQIASGPVHGGSMDGGAPGPGSPDSFPGGAIQAGGVPAPRDLSEVIGQPEARWALEVAAAGAHHLLLMGPPGTGKTMLAECLPSILPPLDREQSLETTAIHSVLGVLPAGALVDRAPFVAPHHSASMAALIGGGSGTTVRPGLVSQAHRGVLFLDETPEFATPVLQALRQPLESGRVVVARARASVSYPARFQLVMAANPCPCGHGWGKGTKCTCRPRERRDYLGRLAGPLLDRVDLQIEVPPVPRVALAGPPGESSAQVLERVNAARGMAAARFAGEDWQVNAQMPGSALRSGRWRLPSSVRVDLDRAIDRGQITLRGYDRVLRLAWTLSDLAGLSSPGRDELGRALVLRQQQEVAA